MRNKRDEDREKEKEWDSRKVGTVKERKIGSTVFFVHQRFVDFPLRIPSKTSRLDYPRRTSRAIAMRFSSSE